MILSHIFYVSYAIRIEQLTRMAKNANMQLKIISTSKKISYFVILLSIFLNLLGNIFFNKKEIINSKGKKIKRKREISRKTKYEINTAIELISESRKSKCTFKNIMKNQNKTIKLKYAAMFKDIYLFRSQIFIKLILT